MKILKQLYYFLLVLTIMAINLNAESVTVYEDAEDGLTNGWFIFDDEPKGATVKNVYDEQRKSYVIELSGNGIDNAYWFKNENGSYWHNLEQFTMEFSLKANEYVRFFIGVNTKNGERILSYDHQDINQNLIGNFIHTGLGASLIDNEWHTYRRNILQDIRRAEPDNAILSINWVAIRGSVKVDDIKLVDNISVALPSTPDNFSAVSSSFDTVHLTWNDNSDNENGFEIYRNGIYMHTTNANEASFTDYGLSPETSYEYTIYAINGVGASAGAAASVTTPEKTQTVTILEDAEDGSTDGWFILDNEPQGSTISAVYDAARNSNVIELSGNGLDNAYWFRNADGSYWDNKTQFIMNLSIKANGYVRIFVGVNTLKGLRTFSCDHQEVSQNLVGDFIHSGLGSTFIDGQWHTYKRDLSKELAKVEPDNEILSVYWLIIRGNASIDDIKLMDEG